MNSRRKFIQTAVTGATGVFLAGNISAGSFLQSGKERPIHVFTKCLQFLSYDEMAEVLAKQGFDGADLTVRPGGQVLPENVKTDLPKAKRSLRNNGIDSKMIATAIRDPKDEHTMMILSTMADLGIKYYRMNWLKYDNDKTILQNLDHHKKTFEAFEKLNRKYGVCGNYQNHSGTNVGAPIWDLHYLLKDRDPEYIGVQYDIRHATVEGGNSWPLGMKLLSRWIQTVDIKDFIWEKNNRQEWILKNVPLGEGMVDFDKYFALYKSLNIKAPVSIHYEYDLGGAEHGGKNPTMKREEIYSWLKKDLIFLENKFEKYAL